MVLFHHNLTTSVDQLQEEVMHKVDISQTIEREWDERAKLLENVRQKLRRGWRNDSNILQEYFRACVINWKSYVGNKPDKVVAKLYGLYKQAVFGDCNEILDQSDWTSLTSKKYIEWKKLKGTTSDEAKRRFITYLAEFDPLLIDVMPNEVPPDGFPVDNQGNQICAKCNTKVGCHRPLMDQHGTILRRQLFELEELHNIDNLRVWVQNALQNQRCIWGVHKPITKIESKKFTEWFNRTENQGYYMYDSSCVMLLIRDLLQLYCEITYDMQINKTEYLLDEINQQTIKTFNLNKYYTELTGQIFIFEIECNRDNIICNELRLHEGKNHKHSIELEPPVVDYSIHEICVKLRKQCQELGIDPRTGIERDILKRCDIYRERIRQYYERQKKSQESKERNINYHHTHRLHKDKIKELSNNVLNKHILHACNENNIEKLLNLSERGGNMNVETSRGIRPLLCLIINQATTIQLNQLIQAGALVDTVNRYGINPLILACRLKDSRTIHVLMKAGAHELITSGYHKNSNISGRSALHYCVLHSSEDEIRTLIDYCLEGGEDALRVVRFLDQQDHNGDTPLILAAKYRNGLICRLLLSLGANPNIRNNQKRIAAYVARSSGHRYLADWLDTKISAGIAKVETYSDLNYEKNLRFSNMKIKEYIMNFSKLFLQLIQSHSSTSTNTGTNTSKISNHFIQCPSRLKSYLYYHSEQGYKDQLMFINRYYHHFISKSPTPSPASSSSSFSSSSSGKFSADVEKALLDMKNLIHTMVSFIREGICYPSAESEEKPLPLTPLMCACLMNDIRSIRLICHEGADPNHCNSHGMTPLMLCSLLQNTESICELLHLGADIHLTDNEGYTALAYSTGLPLPLPLYRTSSNIILNGMNEGTKRWDSEYILKLVLSNTTSIENIKIMIQENIEKSSTRNLENELKHMKLLEANGLSHIESMDDFLKDYASITWRIDSVDHTSASTSTPNEDHDDNHSDSIDSSHIFGENEDHQEEEISGNKNMKKNSLQEIDEILESHKEIVRCPICTLPIPCKHFFKSQSVKEYHEKKLNKNNIGNYSLQSRQDILQKTKNSTSDLKSKISKIKYEKMIEKVLEEAELNDRHTNRNLIFVERYGQKKREGKFLENSGEGDDEDASVGGSGTSLEQGSDHNEENGDENASQEEKSNGNVSAGVEDGVVKEAEAPFIPLPLPVITSSAKPVLKKGTHSHKKYKPHRRVIKFSIESDDGKIKVLDGGIEEGDESISISSYPDSLQHNDNQEQEILISSQSIDSLSNSIENTSPLPLQEDSLTSAPGAAPSIKPVPYGRYTEDEEEAVLTSIREGKKQNTLITKKISLKIGINPVNTTRRPLNMFKEPPDTTKISSYPPATSSASASASASHGTRTRSKNVTNIQQQSSIQKFSFSGWIFSGIYPIEQSYNPYGILSISYLQWGNILNNITKSIQRTSLHSYYHLFPLVNTSTWSITSNKPCQGCYIGIYRINNDNHDNSDIFPQLCLACLYRKLLYNHTSPSKTSTPHGNTSTSTSTGTGTTTTTSDSRRDNTWPFHIRSQDPTHMTNTENEEQLFHLFSLSSSLPPPATPTAPPATATSGTLRQDSKEFIQLPLLPNKRNKLLIKNSSISFNQTYPNINSMSKRSISPTQLSSSSSPPASPPPPPSSSTTKNKYLKSFFNKKNSFLDEEESINSIFSDSSFSSISMETISTNSSLQSLTSTSNKNMTPYGPLELNLIPLLIINTNYDEIERLIRISIQRIEYQTEDGFLYLIRLLQYQIEIYQRIGLWYLSFYIIFDVIDWIISRLGYDHHESLSCLNTLHMMCFHMKMMNVFEKYYEKIQEKLLKYQTNQRKQEILTIIDDNYRDHHKYLKKIYQIYSESQSHSGIPTRHVWKTLYFISGYGGLCQLFFSHESFAYLELFIQFCYNLSTNTGNIAKFCSECLQLQLCMIDEVIKHHIYHIYKKYISKQSQYQESTKPLPPPAPSSSSSSSSSITSPTISSLYQQFISKSDKKRMLEFIQMGTVLPKDFFLPLLKPCLMTLLSSYKLFLHTSHGEAYRQVILELDAEYYYCHVILIQNKWRRYLAKKRKFMTKNRLPVLVSE